MDATFSGQGETRTCLGVFFSSLVHPIGIGRGDLSVDALPPRRQFAVEAMGYFGELIGQIVVFADILSKVVQFQPVVFEKLDQFPIALPYR